MKKFYLSLLVSLSSCATRNAATILNQEHAPVASKPSRSIGIHQISLSPKRYMRVLRLEKGSTKENFNLKPRMTFGVFCHSGDRLITGGCRSDFTSLSASYPDFAHGEQWHCGVGTEASSSLPLLEGAWAEAQVICEKNH